MVRIRKPFQEIRVTVITMYHRMDCFATRIPFGLSHTFKTASHVDNFNIASLFMEEIQNYGCLYHKFSMEFKNKFIRLNCRKYRRQVSAFVWIPNFKVVGRTHTLSLKITEDNDSALSLTSVNG